MSSPIKPPGGGPPGPSTPDGVDDPAKPRAAEGPTETFPETLEGERASEGSPARDEVGAIAEDLRAGRIDTAQAIDRLVDRSLGGVAAQALPPAARAELEAQIRRILAEDPSFSALVKDLTRGR